MDRYNPVLMVTVNGRSLTDPDDPLVISLEHRELGDGGKEATITLANPDLMLLDDPDIQEGKTVEWVFGYPGNLSPLFKGTLFVTEPTFDAYSGLTLRLYVYDAVMDAVWNLRQENWRDPEDRAKVLISEVVEQIAAENGWNAVVEKTQGYVTEIPQPGISDWEFIHDVLAPRAVAEDPDKRGKYRVWFEEDSNTLHFEPVDGTQQPKRVYRFMVENDDPVLLHFRPRVDNQRPDHQDAVGATRTDIDGEGNIVTGDAESDTEHGRWRYDMAQKTYHFEEMPEQQDPAKEDPSERAEDAEYKADVDQSEVQLEYEPADIVVVGDPQIRANDIVSVWNVGQKFSGRYLVDEVTHTIGPSGYTTDISGKKDALPVSVSGDEEKSGSAPIDQDGEEAEPKATFRTVERELEVDWED